MSVLIFDLYNTDRSIIPQAFIYVLYHTVFLSLHKLENTHSCIVKTVSWFLLTRDSFSYFLNKLQNFGLVWHNKNHLGTSYIGAQCALRVMRIFAAHNFLGKTANVVVVVTLVELITLQRWSIYLVMGLNEF